MFGVAAEYTPGDGSPDPTVRAACHATLACRPGYRRRLALMANAWQRRVDLFLFADAEAARAALATTAWRELSAAHPDCRAAAPALLVAECPYGGAVTVMRSAPGPSRGGQSCWRDRLANIDPATVAW